MLVQFQDNIGLTICVVTCKLKLIETESLSKGERKLVKRSDQSAWSVAWPGLAGQESEKILGWREH